MTKMFQEPCGENLGVIKLSSQGTNPSFDKRRFQNGPWDELELTGWLQNGTLVIAS